MSSGSLLDMMRPCGRFVVAGADLEVAAQDAYEPVGELAQRGVVFGAAGLELIVVGTSARRSVQRAEGLGGEGVDDPAIMPKIGRSRPSFARGARDRGWCQRSSCALGRRCSGRVGWPEGVSPSCSHRSRYVELLSGVNDLDVGVFSR
jgi:hypothetical protein